jgi:hypothetical protein
LDRESGDLSISNVAIDVRLLQLGTQHVTQHPALSCQNAGAIGNAATPPQVRSVIVNINLPGLKTVPALVDSSASGNFIDKTLSRSMAYLLSLKSYLNISL